jgi:erythromycin esterase
MKHFFFTLLVAAGGCLLHAQQPLNLDFEKTSVEGAARPWGWSPWQQDPQTRWSLDSTVFVQGKYSYCADASPESGPASMAYWIAPFALQGKNITCSGRIKTDKPRGEVQIVLWAISDTGWLIQGQAPTFTGKTDWTEWRINTNEKAEVHSWYLVLNVSGEGKVWFDDGRLSIDGREQSGMPMAPDFTAKQREWLNKQSATIRTFEPVGAAQTADYSDLAAFKKSVGSARVIALGEATHGTREFFLLKHRLLQYAVEALNVRVFAIEANQLEVEKINRYVCTGESTAEKVIRSMFRVWNTEEMLALIQWMRAYNALHPADPVEFVGFDCQDPALPMDSIARFMSEWAPDLQEAVLALQHDYRAAWAAQYYPQAPDSVRLGWKTRAEKVLVMVEEHKSAWLQRARNDADKRRVEWVHQNARVVVQAAIVAWSQVVSARDTFMAGNIRWIQSQRPADTRMIVWAHDSHIARSDFRDDRFNYHSGNSMGRYLSRMLGDDYRAYGLFTAEGHYSAVVSMYNHKMVAAPGMFAPVGSFDEALYHVAKERGVETLFCNLRAARTQPAFCVARPVRFVGYAVYDMDFSAMMSVPWQFDGLFFVKTTTASRVLP